MKTKLTLSIDKDVVQIARARARARQQSVSAMFSEYVRQSQAHARPVASMVGSLKKYTIDDSKTAIREAYAEKHLH